ncbi:MAG: hypothetical protein ACTSUF_07485 [Candidatus Heimdallarchaeaceae archaeon]
MREITLRIITIIDLLYLASIIMISQYVFLSDIAKMFLSLPYFMLIPYLIGNFFIFSFKRAFPITSEDLVKNYIGGWAVGIVTLFSIGLFLQAIGIFNIYLYTLIIFVFLAVSKLKSIKYGTDIITIVRKLRVNVKNASIVLLVLFFGLIPPIVQSQLWPFPLKYESDGFDIVLLTKEIIQQNTIDIYSVIHLPVVSTLLCIPCMLFNIEPSHYLWGLPFLIYPLFAIAVYLLAHKLSNNVLLSIIAAIFSMCFFGGTTNVFNLFMILPRNLLSLLFLFSLYLSFPKSDSDIGLGLRDAFFTAMLAVLLYSTISFTISPSYNHLPSIFLLIVLVVPLGFAVISHKSTKILRTIIFLICILFSVASITVFLFDIDFPVVSSMAFLNTLSGICSSLGLALLLIRNKHLNINIPFLAVSVLTMLLYHQLGLVQNLVISMMVLTNYVILKRPTSSGILRSIALIMTIVISIYSLHDLQSLVPVGESVALYASVLNRAFTYPLLIMFLLGCIFVLLQKNVKEHLLVFSALVILAFYFLAASLKIGVTTRLLEFLPFPIAYFSSALLSPFQRLLESYEKPSSEFIVRFLPFRKARKNLRIKKSWIFVSILIAILFPSLIQPYSGFLQLCKNKSWPPYTFSDYEYKTGIWIDNNVVKNAIIISDPFTTWIVSSLAGNKLTQKYRMVYDAKGNTHSIFYDSETLSWIKDFFLTSNVSYAETLLNKIWHRYADSFMLNQRIINAKANVSEDVIIVFSGRTSEWLASQTFSDVPFPKSFKWLSSYKKFFASSSFALLYETDAQIYVFKWTKK